MWRGPSSSCCSVRAGQTWKQCPGQQAGSGRVSGGILACGGPYSQRPVGKAGTDPGEGKVRRQMDPMGQDKLDSKRGPEDGAWEERNRAKEDPGPARQVPSSAGMPGPSGVRQEEGRWCWKGGQPLRLPFQSAGRQRRFWPSLTAGRQSHSQGPPRQLQWEQVHRQGPAGPQEGLAKSVGAARQGKAQEQGRALTQDGGPQVWSPTTVPEHPGRCPGHTAHQPVCLQVQEGAASSA